MMPAESANLWDDLLTRAGKDMCNAIGLSEYRYNKSLEALPAGRLGACIPIAGDVKVQLFLLGTHSSVRFLAESLMQWEEGDPPLTRDDVQDAFCELANQFAGVVKRHLSGRDVRLGLPVFVRGVIKPSPHADLYVQEVSWGDSPVVLGLLTSE